jgi:hypothetical protein
MDCRVALLRARANALLSLPRTRTLVAGAARLNAEADAVLAARAAGQSQWGSELSPLFLQKLLELLRWKPVSCGRCAPRGAASSTRDFLCCCHGVRR